jgi:excisionase family DNA binding protein
MSDPKLRRTSRSPLLTVAEVAERLNVSIRSVRRLIKGGKLRIVRVGRVVRVRPEALEALINGE